MKCNWKKSTIFTCFNVCRFLCLSDQLKNGEFFHQNSGDINRSKKGPYKVYNSLSFVLAFLIIIRLYNKQIRTVSAADNQLIFD